MARTCLVYFAAMEIANVSVGRIILCPRSVFVTTGKTPSLMDRKYIRTMAAKKFGMELPIKLKNLIR